MNLNIEAVPWPLWLAQTLAITFLVAGFNALDMYLWRKAFLSSKHGDYRYRIALIVVPLVIGLNMVYVGHADTSGNIEILNAGLFILTLPLFDERLNRFEKVVRLAFVTLVWLVIHRGALMRPDTLVGTVLLSALLAAMWCKRAAFRYRFLGTMLAATVFAGLFWLTVPWQGLDIHMTGGLMVQAIGMYMVMGRIVPDIGYGHTNSFRASRGCPS